MKCKSCTYYIHKQWFDGKDRFLCEADVCRCGKQCSDDGCELYKYNNIGEVL